MSDIKGLFFFFSSRRRHTRWTGDWSSDVCSSDLPGHLPPAERQASACVGRRGGLRACRAGEQPLRAGVATEIGAEAAFPGRSEERRVGKECRSGGSPGQESNNERKK